MSRIHVSFLVALPLLLALSGCTVTKCEGDECDFGFDDDAGNGGNGGGEGGANQGSDGGSAGEGGMSGEGGASAGGDGGSSGEGGSATALTLDEFCSAQLAIAVAWRDQFDTCCTTANFPDADRSDLLSNTFALRGLEKCADDRQAQIDAATVVYDGTRAQACADAFAAQFTEPEVMCPAAGFDLSQLRANQGHGASLLVQIPACREAFAGTVAKDSPCTDSFECTGGLRCLPASGSGAGTNKTCQDAIATGGTCTSFADCADGLTCLGGSASGLVCRASNDLSLNGANCSADRQCAAGLVCDFASSECAAPVADLVCN